MFLLWGRFVFPVSSFAWGVLQGEVVLVFGCVVCFTLCAMFLYDLFLTGNWKGTHSMGIKILFNYASDIGSAASQFSLSEVTIIWQVCIQLNSGWCSCAHLAHRFLILQLVAGQ